MPPQLVEIHPLGTTFVKATVNKQGLFWLQSTQQAGLTSQITLLDFVCQILMLQNLSLEIPSRLRQALRK